MAWIGKEDGLMYGYTVAGSFPAEGELQAFTTSKSVRFSNFNGDFTIPSVDDGGSDPSDVSDRDGGN